MGLNVKPTVPMSPPRVAVPVEVKNEVGGDGEAPALRTVMESAVDSGSEIKATQIPAFRSVLTRFEKKNFTAVGVK